MDTIFMNSENSKTTDPHVLILKLSDKLDLRSGAKVLLYQILVFSIHRKTERAHIITINLKYQLQHGMMNLSYQIDYILYQIFKTISSIFLKNMERILIILQ